MQDQNSGNRKLSSPGVVIQHAGREERVGAVLAHEGQRFVVGVRKVSLRNRVEIKKYISVKLEHVKALKGWSYLDCRFVLEDAVTL